MSGKPLIQFLLVNLFLPCALLAQAAPHLPKPRHRVMQKPIPAIAQAQRPRADIVQDVSFQSASLAREVTYRVVLPPDYETSGMRYPVMYLLHGLWGTYTDWDTNTHLREVAARFPVIIVLPEGHNSWYTNAEKPPQDRYEDFLIKDLIPEVEKSFRTLQSRTWRAVAGLSMGGYGSMKFALRRPDLFAFAGSLSGALREDDFIERYKQVGTLEIFGEPGSPTRSNNDVFLLAQKVDVNSLPFLYLACGTEDPHFPENRDFADLLQKRKVRHQFMELPGVHDWNFWDQQLPPLLETWWHSMPEGRR